ncbi:hypothetical protein MKX64_06985 [Paenibacillus sp. FSL M8-0334]|uniref:hypothetical protein n=1 Tax=Paenibacillus sp. FSL M8-0334 TaxID=2921623 RepID=UPI001E470FF4
MHNIRMAMNIIEKDFRSDKFQVLWTLLFTLYMVLVTGITIGQQFEDLGNVFPFVDFILFFYVPMMSLWFSRRSFRYLNEDSYTQMLYYYRTLPIPVPVIVYSRLIMGLMAFLFNGLIYYGSIYLISPATRAIMDIPSYLAFVGIWQGIGFLVSGFYIYWEFMVSGKAYFHRALLLILITSIAVVSMSMMGFSLFKFSAESAMRWKLLSPVMWGSLIIGLGTFLLLGRRTLHMLKNKRDLA